ncbi:hypothetical protein H0H81_002789, partial [Sphagnurus paluster]
WRLSVEPMTVKTMYKWIDTAIAWDPDNGGENAALLEYALFPIDIEHGKYALEYNLHRNAPSLSRSSHDYVTVGSFGIYTT